ncbi:fimbrial protein [Salmonella enterica subsp. enterica]|nr:fimbrial protein [Salmonella enterica subsp. enterica]EJD8908355.1 fimbrial protein [Salmonella enterica]HEC7027120.1 fimbrial protein [Salmonella enterica subsp. enterica serovar Mgulani]ECK2061488.1 fimbrial protein [Salmonella enterica subsp. enterica]EDP9766031.1 fimbrial protein [Salmonella enterica subsp. enterica]
MTLNKVALLALTSSLALLMAGLPSARGATATATVTLKATFTAPPCTLTVPPTVFLGSILQGEKTYRPFSIDISCPSPVRTVVYAQQMGSSLVSGNAARMEMSGPAGASGTPAQFWLNAEGKDILLDGSGATDETRGFCDGTTNRACTLTPSTLVAPDTPRGQTTATIRFSVMYP